MSSIIVRLAEETDNEQLQALVHRCPQEGMITFYPVRRPLFNSVHRLFDPESWHMVACDGERIIGLVGVIHFKAMVLGKSCKLGYMLDLRMDPEYRSGVAAFRLVRAAVDHIMQSDTDMIIANFLKDNKRPLVFTEGRGGLPRAHFLGENKLFNIIPLRRMKLISGFDIATPQASDIPEMVELYGRYAKGFKIAPLIHEETFRKHLEDINGLSLDSFLIARSNGRIKAMTALWDDQRYISHQVLRLSTSIAAVNNTMKILSPFFPLPHPIRLNEPLKQHSLVFYAHDNCPEALETLFRHVNNIRRGTDTTLISLYAQEKDPVFQLVKRFFGVSIKSHMYIFARDESIYEKLAKNPQAVMQDVVMTL
ncbi:MAG TPA: hypothetical protein PKE03_10025 [Bacteroidales bacterium]|nr:hypothetical protein [Bacteroidales bacterium]